MSLTMAVIIQGIAIMLVGCGSIVEGIAFLWHLKRQHSAPEPEDPSLPEPYDPWGGGPF